MPAERPPPRWNPYHHRRKPSILDPKQDPNPPGKDYPISNQRNMALEHNRPCNPEEQRIHDLAESAYTKALSEYQYPSLPDPDLIFDYSKEKGFFINNQTWQVTLNLANTPDIHLNQEITDYFFMLSFHEIGHYCYCPFDGITDMKLMAAAIEGGVFKFYAPIVVNIFSDLLIDYRSHQKYPQLMEWELNKDVEKMRNEKPNGDVSNLWKFLVRCYEVMWNFHLDPSIEAAEVESQVKRVTALLLKDVNDEQLWLAKVKSMAKILKELLKESCHYTTMFPDKSGSGAGATQPGNGASGDSSSNPFTIPDDVRETFGDLTQIKNPDQIKSGGLGAQKESGPNPSSIPEHTAEELATGSSYGAFAGVLSLCGYDNVQQIMALWYRGQTRNALAIQIFEKKPGGALPSYIIPWRLGDPLEDLDILQTLLVSPVVIPNMTTRKWMRIEGPGQTLFKALPDMMLVIDSSGSMTWDVNQKKIEGPYHVALLAAFSAMQTALAHGCYVSAINFSSRVLHCDWTNQRDKIEHLLLSYQGSGTIMPLKVMRDLLRRVHRPALIMIISDLDLQNWEETYQTFMEILTQKHTLVAFFIGGDERYFQQPLFQNLLQAGARFYCINDLNDLLHLVISEVRKTYE